MRRRDARSRQPLVYQRLRSASCRDAAGWSGGAPLVTDQRCTIDAVLSTVTDRNITNEASGSSHACANCGSWIACIERFVRSRNHQAILSCLKDNGGRVCSLGTLLPSALDPRKVVRRHAGKRACEGVGCAEGASRVARCRASPASPSCVQPRIAAARTEHGAVEAAASRTASGASRPPTRPSAPVFERARSTRLRSSFTCALLVK